MIATTGQLKPAFVAASRPMRINRRAGTAFAVGAFNSGTAEVEGAELETTVSGDGAVTTDAKSYSFKKVARNPPVYLIVSEILDKVGPI